MHLFQNPIKTKTTTQKNIKRSQIKKKNKKNSEIFKLKSMGKIFRKNLQSNISNSKIPTSEIKLKSLKDIMKNVHLYKNLNNKKSISQ